MIFFNSTYIQGTLDILTEQSFIKEKVAKLFAEIAKKEWPSRWNDMDKLFQRLYSESVRFHYRMMHILFLLFFNQSKIHCIIRYSQLDKKLCYLYVVI